MKLFQLVITERIDTVISAGRESGSRTRQKNPKRRAAVDRRRVLELGAGRAHERAQDDDRDRDPERRLGERDPERASRRGASWRSRRYSGSAATAIGNSSPSVKNV